MILLKNLDPHRGVARGDPRGVAQAVAGKITPTLVFTGQKSGERGGQHLRQVTDVGDDLVMLIGRDRGHLGAEFVPEAGHSRGGNRVGVFQRRDKTYATFEEGVRSVFPTGLLPSSHGVRADKMTAGGKRGVAGTAEFAFDAADVGGDHTGGQVRCDLAGKGDDGFNGRGKHDHGRLTHGFLGSFGDCLAPRLSAQFKPCLGTAGPNGYSPSKTAGVRGLGDRATKQTGSENDEVFEHTLWKLQPPEDVEFNDRGEGSHCIFSYGSSYSVFTSMSAPRSSRNYVPFLHAARPWMLGFLGLVALGYFFYFLTTLGPRRIGNSSSDVLTPGDPIVAKLSIEISDLWKQYQDIADAGLVTQAALDKLTLALGKQKTLVRVYPNAGLDQSSRLSKLETELGTATAKLKVIEIDRLEKDGSDATRNADSDMAKVKFTEALRLQREINLSSASSRYKNYVRETSFVQQLARLEAAPLQKQMEAAVIVARQAAAEKRWSDALAAYMSARDLQDRINREYGRTIFADLSAVDSLDSEIESLNAAGIAADIDAKQKQGDEAVAAGKSLLAAAFFGSASTLQINLNQKFPRSRFVSPDRIARLEVKQQTAFSTTLADSLAALTSSIGEHLKKRQIVLADQKISEAMTTVETLFAKYPKSQRIDGDLKLKLAYLALKRPDLRGLQDDVYERLLPLPGASDRLLLKTEVPQSLYVLIMNTNPSRNPGREFPVDSVSWGDAKVFCTRLGWLLGATVRLPTMDEFRVALGAGQKIAWSQTNSDGHSQLAGSGRPNGTGFFNLVGNLSEWTGTEADDKANVFGGSYLDMPDALAQIPSETRPKTDRARHVGFRFVVDLVLP